MADSKSPKGRAPKAQRKTTSKPKTETKSKTKPTSPPKTPKSTKPKAKPKAKPKVKKAEVKPKTKARTRPAAKAKPKVIIKPPKAVKPKKPKPRRLPLEKPLTGVLLSFQRGSVRQRNHYGLIRLEGVTNIGQAAQYIGRTVILYFHEETSITGRILSVHGRNGVLRARFRRGLAPAAIAKEVKVF